MAVHNILAGMRGMHVGYDGGGEVKDDKPDVKKWLKKSGDSAKDKVTGGTDPTVKEDKKDDEDPGKRIGDTDEEIGKLNADKIAKEREEANKVSEGLNASLAGDDILKYDESAPGWFTKNVEYGFADGGEVNDIDADSVIDLFLEENPDLAELPVEEWPEEALKELKDTINSEGIDAPNGALHEEEDPETGEPEAEEPVVEETNV